MTDQTKLQPAVAAEQAVRTLMEFMGEDVTREGLVETPSRVVKAYTEWFSGYGQDPKDLFKVFEDGGQDADEMVLLTNIPVFSHCEHHITPIVGVAHVAYIPNQTTRKIVGISKLARLVEVFSRRLQVQERLTNQIANALVEGLDPQGVGVVITAKHFCMATRGVKMPNVDTTTSALRGVLKTEQDCRAEFLKLIDQATRRA